MPSASTLLLFSAAVLGLLLSPGPNMAMVVSQGAAHGARGGIASAAGIFVADLLMTLLVCAGIAAVITAWPPSFALLRWAGAGYLAWLAWNAWHRHERAAQDAPVLPSPWQAFRGAALVSLLNPKALLFFLVLLPQFADPHRGNIPPQLLVLGLLLSSLAFFFHALLGMVAGRVVRAFRRNTGALRWLDRLQVGVLLGLAMRLLLLERPLHP